MKASQESQSTANGGRKHFFSRRDRPDAPCSCAPRQRGLPGKRIIETCQTCEGKLGLMINRTEFRASVEQEI